jgi:hypothetical protein
MGTAGRPLPRHFPGGGFSILLVMTNRQGGAISIRIKDFAPSVRVYKRIVYNGFPPWGGRGSPACPPYCSTPPREHGDAAIAAMSIVSGS